jgi:hypothetical protein
VGGELYSLESSDHTRLTNGTNNGII